MSLRERAVKNALRFRTAGPSVLLGFGGTKLAGAKVKSSNRQNTSPKPPLSRDGSAVRVEQAVWGGNNKVNKPKTQNAYRVVDLHPDVASLLRQYIGNRSSGFIFQTSSGRPITQTNILRREFHPLLDNLEIPRCGWHAFRRFRNTFLRQQRCPDGLLKFWMGHSGGGDMSELYDRSRDDVEYRRDVAKAMGVGFELPKTVALRGIKTSQSGANGPQTETAESVVSP
jgi:hypothetical protein